jgi:hypothetical protein
MNAWLGLWLCWLQHNFSHWSFSQPSPKFMSFYCMYLHRWSTPDGHSIGLQRRTWRHHYEWFSNESVGGFFYWLYMAIYRVQPPHTLYGTWVIHSSSLIVLTYSKGRRGRETFSIHPPVIHPWMASYREGNPGRNKITPPLHMCHCLGKACPALVSGLLPWSAVCCYLTGDKQCKHQDFQQPGSRWIHEECGM